MKKVRKETFETNSFFFTFYNDRSIVGRVFDSNNFGKFEVVEKTNIKQGSQFLYKIRFKKTKFNDGFECLSLKCNILRGEVKNPYYPNIKDVACTGDYNIKFKFLKSRWMKMLDRCYSPKNKNYRTYGNVGIKVCDRWLCFENYIEDVINLEGFDLELVKKSKLQLDKDKKHTHGVKQYAPENCMWISQSENSKEMQRRTKQKLFKATRINDGYIEVSYNQIEFGKKWNIPTGNISSCLHDKRPYTKGWKFEFIDYGDLYDSL